MNRPIRILLQTTIPETEDDWHIGRFSLLRDHLASLKDEAGNGLCQVTARNRESDAGADDPVLSTLDRSDFDELWLFAVDIGDGLTAADCRGITRFRQRGGGVHVSIDALGRAFTVHQSIQSLRKRGRHVQVGLTSQEERGQVAIPIDTLVTGEWEVVGSKGNPHPNYAELLPLVARRKLNPARLVTRQIALSDVTDTLERMTCFDTVGFEVITRFA